MIKHVLNTGQTFCADLDGIMMDCAHSGQDAEYAPGICWPTPRFIFDEGIVTDRLTELQWTLDANPAEFPLTHAEAVSFIEEMNRRVHAGHHDWRMPNRRELRSLISFNARTPALPKGHPFERVQSAWYWTGTESALQPGYFWYVHLEGGRMFYGRRDNYSLLWPVRGTSPVLPATGAKEPSTGVPWPAQRFTSYAETIVDALTGLTWARNADIKGKATTWQKALDAVHVLNKKQFSGRSDWRLPTINELESLIDASRHTPALPKQNPFSNTRDGYWSSTSSSFEPDWAMCLYLNKGAVGVGWKQDTNFHVWPVAGI